MSIIQHHLYKDKIYFLISGDRLNRIILMISAVCLISISGMATAQNATGETINVLSQDRGANITQMNYYPTVNFTYYSAVNDYGIYAYAIGEAVKFTAPRDGWNLKQVRIFGNVGYNGTAIPIPQNFLIEVRDEKLNLLHQFADTQNAYFLFEFPVLRAIDIPALPLTGDFYVIFYDRGTMEIGMETENGTGSSYVYDSIYGKMSPAEFKIENSEPVKINWVIRAVGE